VSHGDGWVNGNAPVEALPERMEWKGTHQTSRSRAGALGGDDTRDERRVPCRPRPAASPLARLGFFFL